MLSMILSCQASDFIQNENIIQRYINYYQLYPNFTPQYTLTAFKQHLNAVLNTHLEVNDNLDSQTASAVSDLIALSNLNDKKLDKLIDIYQLPFSIKKSILSDSQQQLQDIKAQHDSKFIIVNIPEFKAMGYELQNNEYKLAIETPVIIGKTNRKTPLLTSNVIAVKFNPTWTPPPTILKQDIYKGGQLNTSYIHKHRLKAYHNGQSVDLTQLNQSKERWDSLSTDEEYSVYENSDEPAINIKQLKFTQPAGVDNALGVLKFELDNNQNIYLHDTNQHNLFKERIRSFSSGCVRVQEYKKLASWVLSTSVEDIEKKINTHKSFSIKTDKIPVYIVYWPFSIQNNNLVFLNDIYKLKYDTLLKGK